MNWDEWEPKLLEVGQDGLSLDLGDNVTATLVLQYKNGPLPVQVYHRVLREKVLPHVASFGDALDTESIAHDEARVKIHDLSLKLACRESEYTALYNEKNAFQTENTILQKRIQALHTALEGYRAREAEFEFREHVARSMQPGDNMFLISTGEVVRLDKPNRWFDPVSETTIDGWTCWRAEAREFNNIPNADLVFERPAQETPRMKLNYWLLGGMMAAASAMTVLAHLAVHLKALPLLNH